LKLILLERLGIFYFFFVAFQVLYIHELFLVAFRVPNIWHRTILLRNPFFHMSQTTVCQTLLLLYGWNLRINIMNLTIFFHRTLKEAWRAVEHQAWARFQMGKAPGYNPLCFMKLKQRNYNPLASAIALCHIHVLSSSFAIEAGRDTFLCKE
jgi:hypothetical protein